MNKNKTSLMSLPRSSRPFCKFEVRNGCKNVNCPFQHRSLLHKKSHQVTPVPNDPEEEKKLKELLQQPDFFNSPGSSKENRPPKRQAVSVYKKVNTPNEGLRAQLESKKRFLEEEMQKLLKERDSILQERATKRTKKSPQYPKEDPAVQQWLKILGN